MKNNLLKRLLLVIGKKNIFSLSCFIPLIFLISLLEVIGITSLIPVLQYLSGQEMNFFNINFEKALKQIPETSVLYFFLIFILIINLIRFFLSILNNYLFNKCTLDIQISMQKKILQDFIHGSWFSTIDKNTSEKLRDINEETTILKSNLILPFFSTISELLIIFSMLFFLYLHSDLKILIIVFIAVIICFLFFKLNKNRLFNYGRYRRKYEKTKNQRVLEAIRGLREIKFFNFSKKITEDFLNIANKLKNIYLKQSILLIIPKNLLEIAVLFFLMMIIIYFYNKGLSFDQMISSLAIYIVATFKIIPSFYKTMNNIQAINFALPTIIALNDVISRDYKLKKNNDETKCEFNNYIELRNISFSYPKSKINILNNVNLKIKKDTIIGIIGESGSGKSTFIDLITGLIEPSKGSVIVDDKKDIINEEAWKKNFGIVTQKIYLFEASIKDNVTLFQNDNFIDLKKLYDCLNKVNLIKYSNKKGLNELVKEDGINLSGGERQRLGLARCLYQDRNIIILDEPTNNLDEKSENRFYETLNNLKNNKTIIIVSHNKKLVSFCDEILFIENGSILRK